MVIVLVLLLLALAAVACPDHVTRAAPPFGPAANGSIVYGYGGDLYVRDTLQAEQRLLIGGPGEQGGVIHSLDGQLLAYDNVVDGTDKVTVANADGTNPRTILDEPFTGGAAAWSPDSRSMALTTTKPDGRSVLWIAAADGSGAREVSVEGIRVLDAVYNPADDGTLLIRGDAVGAVDVYLIDLDGTIVRDFDLPGDMLYGAEWELSGLAFSPDGRTIAYNSVEPGDRFRTQLVDVDGTNRRPIAPPVGAAADYSQAWSVFSPDGRWIALESWVGVPGGPAVNQLAIAPTDGSAPARGIGPKLPNQAIVKTWSPDGTKVLFAASDALQLFEADPVTGEYSDCPGTASCPTGSASRPEPVKRNPRSAAWTRPDHRYEMNVSTSPAYP